METKQVIDYVLQRIRSKLYVINQLKPVAPTVLRPLYRAFVLPIIDYCDTVWPPSNASSFCRLERFHSKFLLSLPSPHNLDLDMTLVECRTFHRAVQVFRILHNVSPTYMRGLFSYATDVTGRTGRNPHQLYVPRIRTNYGKRSLNLDMGPSFC